ncbi:non-homologous end-joining factor 1 isoform X2 [Cyclopterus lumpus]|uniref:non-homologous end-joining factor 1 isoform X2 n=1 Tax=Cyclopterus lumpus TaxID=8103 RepID=UPI0014870D17|nr:non-homologous end-joining factor 1 isoform X2 [Cyclopterus lumpus]
MEARGAPADVLLQLPWLPVSIGGCQLLAKSWFGETAYHLLLTDVNCVWEERMDSVAIQRRAQELNRRLRAKVEAFFSHLREVAQPCLTGSGGQADGGEAQVSLTRQEDGNIGIKLKSELVGLPFYWEFHCTPAPVTVVCAQLVRPLLAMSHLLQQQVEQQGGLLGRKDAEIQDYRENGAVLSRERLQTDVFEEKTYREDFMSKSHHTVVFRASQLGYGERHIVERLVRAAGRSLFSYWVVTLFGSGHLDTTEEEEEEEEGMDQSLLPRGKYHRAATRPPPDRSPH